MGVDLDGADGGGQGSQPDGPALEAAGANEGADVWGADMAHIISRTWGAWQAESGSAGSHFSGEGVNQLAVRTAVPDWTTQPYNVCRNAGTSSGVKGLLTRKP